MPQHIAKGDWRPEVLAHLGGDFALVASLARIGYWHFDIQTQQSHWSAAAYRMHGLDPAEGSPSVEAQAALFPPGEFDRLMKLIEDAIRSDGKFEMEYTIRRPDGERRHLRSRGQVLQDDKGAPVGV